MYIKKKKKREIKNVSFTFLRKLFLEPKFSFSEANQVSVASKKCVLRGSIILKIDFGPRVGRMPMAHGPKFFRLLGHCRCSVVIEINCPSSKLRSRKCEYY